jgi:predicted nucleotidyltransferase
MAKFQTDGAVGADSVGVTLARLSVPGVASVYVFGSRSEGRAHRESDLDFAVLLDRGFYPTDRERFEARLRLIAELSSRFPGTPIDLVVLNDAPPLLARRIVTQGRRVFCADPAADHAFVRDVQLRAADLAPFLRRMRRIKLDAIAR